MKIFIFLLLALACAGCNNSGTPGRDYNIDNTDNDDTSLKPPPVLAPAIDSVAIDSINKR